MTTALTLAQVKKVLQIISIILAIVVNAIGLYENLKTIKAS